MKKKLIVITSGSGNSGTGAIHDYLSNRPDFNSPFFGQEFRLISDPYGIENLYNNFFHNFSLNNSSEALDQFKQYSLDFLKIKYRDKKIIYNEKNFLNEVSNYIKNIKKLEYSGYPQYKRVSKSNTINTVFKIKKIFMKMKNHEFHENKMFLSVTEKEFIKSTKNFLTSIMSINLKEKKNNKNIILDQSTNFWKPEIALKYFNSPKILLINRDPRGVYYSMRSRQSFSYPGYDINLFVHWYQNIMDRRKIVTKKYKNNIREINFEKFLLNFNNEKKKLNSFLKISNKMPSNFNHEISIKNIFKAEKFLSNNDLKLIKKKLKKHLVW